MPVQNVAAYTIGSSVALDRLGIDKTAGLRDAIRVALTGRVPLRHGTSANIGKKIMQDGIVP